LGIINQPMPENNSSIFKFVDDSFNAADAKHIELCIHCGVNRISYALFDQDNDQCIRLESLDPNIKQHPGSLEYNDAYFNAIEHLIKNEKWEGKNFQSVKILIDNEHYTLVPKALFQEKEEEKFLAINQEIFAEKEYVFRNDYIKAKDLVNIFVFPASLIKALGKDFPTAIIKHYISVLLDNLDHSGLIVNLGNTYLDIISFKGAQLRFCQSYQFKSKEDILYHILHVTNHLGLDTKKDPVTVLGEIDQGSDNYLFLKDYINQLNLISKPADINFRNEPEGIKYQQFFTLLSLRKCES